MANNNLDDLFKDIFYAFGCTTDNKVTADDIEFEEVGIIDHHDHGSEVQLEGEDENGIIYYACGYKSESGEIEVDSETIETDYKTRSEK